MRHVNAATRWRVIATDEEAWDLLRVTPHTMLGGAAAPTTYRVSQVA